MAVRSQNLIRLQNLPLRCSGIACGSMAGRLSRWISALRAGIRCQGELLLELIVLRYQIAVLQQCGQKL
jgi:hypothetical protein